MGRAYLNRAGIMFILMLGLIHLAGCGSGDSNNRQTAADRTPGDDSLVIELVGQDGRSVFDITRENHQVEFMESPVGNFMEAIDSIEIGRGYSWIYSVNDSIGQVASDRFVTKAGDRIKWHYRKQ